MLNKILVWKLAYYKSEIDNSERVKWVVKIQF